MQTSDRLSGREFESEADVTAHAAIQPPCTDSKDNEAQPLQTKRVPAMASGLGRVPTPLIQRQPPRRAAGEVVWEYINPHFTRSNTPGGGSLSNAAYRAQPVPYRWVPEGTPHSERAVVPPDPENFRILPQGK